MLGDEPDGDGFAFTRLGLVVPANAGLPPVNVLSSVLEDGLNRIMAETEKTDGWPVLLQITYVCGEPLTDPASIEIVHQRHLACILVEKKGILDVTLLHDCEDEDEAVDILRQHQMRPN